MIDSADLENRFNYHQPLTDTRRQNHENVRGFCLALAERLNRMLPDGHERDEAIHKLEEVMFWANAALARQPDGPGDSRDNTNR